VSSLQTSTRPTFGSSDMIRFMAMFEYSKRSPSHALPSVIVPITGAAFSNVQFICVLSVFRRLFINR